MREQLVAAAPHAPALLGTAAGRRAATRLIATSFEPIPAELIGHQMLGAAACAATAPMAGCALREGYRLDAERIECPVRIVWGADDLLLRWPSAAVRYRDDWLPHADWVMLDASATAPRSMSRSRRRRS